MRKPGTFTTAEVAKMVGLTEARVRTLVAEKFVQPERDGTHLSFTFQDLVLLRAAKALFASKVSPRRVHSALRRLAEELPTGRPLTALTLRAEGDRVVVDDGKLRWQADTGQTMFDFSAKDASVHDFSVKELVQKAAPITQLAHQRAHARPNDLAADDWYELGCALELSDIAQARDAYRRAIELQPRHGAAHLNLGRLLHEEQKLEAAISHYRLALQGDGDQRLALFNLGVALTDSGALDEARDSYEAVLAIDPDHADSHYNLAAVLERLGKRGAAIQHLQAYKRLVS